MKKLVLGASILVLSMAVIPESKAQVRVGVNINIGDQPSWRVPGYDYAEYYYLPDIECYYYVPRHQFIYLSGGRWIFSASLPARYRGYNLHTGYKVVINRHNAYQYYEQDRRRYVKRQHFRNNRWRNDDNGNRRGRHRNGGRHH